jgi:hypothetical protein
VTVPRPGTAVGRAVGLSVEVAGTTLGSGVASPPGRKVAVSAAGALVEANT